MEREKIESKREGERREGGGDGTKGHGVTNESH